MILICIIAIVHNNDNMHNNNDNMHDNAKMHNNNYA